MLDRETVDRIVYGDLIERLSKAITDAHFHGGDWDDCARAALAVARPAIRNQVLDEVEQLMRIEWASLYGLSQSIGGYNLNGAMRARDAADAISVVIGKVEALRSDSKGDSKREDAQHVGAKPSDGFDATSQQSTSSCHAWSSGTYSSQWLTGTATPRDVLTSAGEEPASLGAGKSQVALPISHGKAGPVSAWREGGHDD